MKLTNKLYYDGLVFYFTGTNLTNERIYKSLDELIHLQIITAPSDYDGVLIGKIDECYREDEEDDMIRYFHWSTGKEEQF